MKQEHKDKQAANRIARTENRMQQKIKIGKYTVSRFDSLNWTIDPFKDICSRRPYYGTLPSALYDLPFKRLNDGEKNSIQQVCEELRAIRKDIQGAIVAIRKYENAC